MKIESFKNLTVWQRSMDLVYEVYSITNKLPAKETYALANQLQRASVSIPSNIAEGSKRSSRVDFRQFCLIALGSAAEVETQLMIVERIYSDIVVQDTLGLVVEIQKMLTALAASLKKSTS